MTMREALTKAAEQFESQANYFRWPEAIVTSKAHAEYYDGLAKMCRDALHPTRCTDCKWPHICYRDMGCNLEMMGIKPAPAAAP